MSDIITKLKELRKQKKASQDAVAEACGVSRVTIARYENGSRKPEADVLPKLAAFYGVTVDYLVGRDEEQKEPAVDLSGFDPDLVEAMRDVRPEEKAAVLALISGLKASRKE